MVTKFTRHEFAEVCKIPNNTLTILAKRGKIAINSARCAACEKKKKPCGNCKTLEFIDLDHRTKDGFYINLDFFKKATEGIEPVKKPRELKPKDPIVKPKGEISVPVLVNDESEEADEEEDLFGDVTAQSSDAVLTRAKKFEEIQNKRADTRLKELKESQMRGDVIPVEIVKNIIQFLGENQKRAFCDATESIVMLVVERLNAQEHDKAYIRTGMLSIINKAINQSVNESQEKLDQFIPNELQTNPT
jgi:hypothetical protein